jgi:hypothetical protein
MPFKLSTRICSLIPCHSKGAVKTPVRQLDLSTQGGDIGRAERGFATALLLALILGVGVLILLQVWQIDRRNQERQHIE